MCSSDLYLPSLNAAIIDKGVLQGNNRFIWTHGGQMLIDPSATSTARHAVIC